ncbi:MAG: hypothetical protein WB762_30040 [Candidatus Sulfotelmatobacter sp.]
MTAPVVVDSNVFLYALDEADLRKQRAAQNRRTELWKSRRGRVSFQVLGEFYGNALRLLPEVRDEARAEVRDLLAWNPVWSNASSGVRREAAKRWCPGGLLQFGPTALHLLRGSQLHCISD